MNEKFDVVVQCGHIRRGFPFRVTGQVCPAEHDVGIMSSYLDDMDITTISGKNIGFLHLTIDEIDEIEIEVWEQFCKCDSWEIKDE